MTFFSRALSFVHNVSVALGMGDSGCRMMRKHEPLMAKPHLWSTSDARNSGSRNPHKNAYFCRNRADASTTPAGQCCLTRKSMQTSVFGRAPREPPSTTLPQRSDHMRHSKQTVCLREDSIVHAYFGIKGVNACFARAGNLLCDSDCSSLGLSGRATVLLTISRQKMQWSLASATIVRHVAAKRSF